MRRVVKYRNFWVMLGADALLILFSFYFACFLRFEGIIPEKEMGRLLQSLIKRACELLMQSMNGNGTLRS